MSVFIAFSTEEQQNIQLVVSFLLISELLYKKKDFYIVYKFHKTNKNIS